MIKACLPHANKSIRIGITGIPGAGKSTFIEVLGKYLTSLGKRVAVLAIERHTKVILCSALKKESIAPI
ncbi:hypothetical protein ACFFU9_10290 [Mariniflexile ostreae]|uniref:ArgK protein n=1 Tax=Mariniflexile ostreae TaxID=1520892 RepID=A0ABV5FCG4_9FLAO